MRAILRHLLVVEQAAGAQQAAKRPLRSDSSAKPPISTTRPLSMNMTRSASRTVVRRWAMMKVVRSCRSSSIASLTRVLGLDVERAGRLVEHQDRRVLEHGAGNGDALALAARKLAAALADDGVVAVALGQDEILRGSRLGGGMDLVIGRARRGRCGCCPRSSG